MERRNETRSLSNFTSVFLYTSILLQIKCRIICIGKSLCGIYSIMVNVVPIIASSSYRSRIIKPLLLIVFRYILCWWKFAVCMNMCDFRSAVHIHYDLNSSLSSFSISTFHSTFGFFHLKVNFFSVRVFEFPQECLFLFLLCRKEKNILSIIYIDRTNIIPSSSESDIWCQKVFLTCV